VAAKNEQPGSLDARSLVFARAFDAPRNLVFEAFTDPVHLGQWWGPNGFTITNMAFDFRPGGVWRFVMHGPDGRDYQNCITFDEILRPERIVYRHGGGADVESVQFTATVTFADEAAKTWLNWCMVLPSVAERDRVIREYGAEEGLRQTVGRLADHVGKIAAVRRGVPDLVLTRILDAPRILVFKLWTDANHLAQWWGPHGYTNPVCEADARPGGAIRIHMRAPDGRTHAMTGVYREVVAPERLVFTNVVPDEKGNRLFEILNTVTLEDAGDGKTKLMLRASVIAATDAAAPYLAGMDKGWSQTLERLAAHVAAARRG
jgi:uncharacterized protein YndB with AHSA1/START domain